MKELTRRDFFKKSLATASITLLSGSLRMVEAQELGFTIPKKARYYTKLDKKKIQCNLCPKQCYVTDGARGVCEVRENRDGEYYTLVWGNPCAVHIDPIEKKPLFHFLPTTNALSIATAGCNIECKYCQNWQISQAVPEDTYNYELPPETVVALALREKCKTIAYTYTEPCVFYEYMLETSKLARESGIRNLWITNGFLNKDPLLELCDFLDTANVDLKGFTEKFYASVCSGALHPVLNTLKTLKKRNVHFEITNLIVPTKNDDMATIRKMCMWIRDELGADYPLHFSRFHPMYKYKNLPPTRVETLEQARNTALDVGLKYVYIGNVYGHKGENTYCPNCKKAIVKRTGFFVSEYKIKNGKCQYCGYKIYGVWE